MLARRSPLQQNCAISKTLAVGVSYRKRIRCRYQFRRSLRHIELKRQLALCCIVKIWQRKPFKHLYHVFKEIFLFHWSREFFILPCSENRRRGLSACPSHVLALPHQYNVCALIAVQSIVFHSTRSLCWKNWYLYWSTVQWQLQKRL